MQRDNRAGINDAYPIYRLVPRSARERGVRELRRRRAADTDPIGRDRCKETVVPAAAAAVPRAVPVEALSGHEHAGMTAAYSFSRISCYCFRVCVGLRRNCIDGRKTVRERMRERRFILKRLVADACLERC